MVEEAEFFYYVIPSVLAFALSGVYAIVDRFSSETASAMPVLPRSIANPTRLLHFCRRFGTGIGMGGPCGIPSTGRKHRMEIHRITLAPPSLSCFPSVS